MAGSPAVFVAIKPAWVERRIVQSYRDAGKMPERGTLERARYVESYYLICAIRLDG